MNQYQKVYMNQIHSSSLLGQLAQMWRSQMLCDALIRTGNVTTKAHRVVLVAACPMLQSMDNASVGSHLEVRLAADIKQEAVNSFLQYLYEGFMMLTEENCRDIEKVARLLQVDNVTKCCIDFYNCLQKKTGVPVYSNTQYKYSSADLLEFRHVRTTDLQKTIHERMMKRAAADSVRPSSPGGKRPRTQQQRPLSPNIDLAMFGQKADDTLSMAHSYMGNVGNQTAADPWERVPIIGAGHMHRPHPKSGVIEIVEDSLEILQTQPPDKDGNKSVHPVVQKSLAISVSSQVNPSTDVHVVHVNDSSTHPTVATDGPVMNTGRDSITVSPLTVMPGSSTSSTSSPLAKESQKSYERDLSDKGPYAKKPLQSADHQSSTPQRGPFPVSMSPASMSPISQVGPSKKSFAAGSASQAASMSSPHDSTVTSKRSSSSSAIEMLERPQTTDLAKDQGEKSKVDDGSASNSTDMAPDLSIVKIEPTSGDPGLDMYVDVPDESMIQAQQREQREHDDESDLELEEASGDWSRDEISTEAGGGDQNNSWYIGQFKGLQFDTAEENQTQRYQILPLTSDTYYGHKEELGSNDVKPMWFSFPVNEHSSIIQPNYTTECFMTTNHETNDKTNLKKVLTTDKSPSKGNVSSERAKKKSNVIMMKNQRVSDAKGEIKMSVKNACKSLPKKEVSVKKASVVGRLIPSKGFKAKKKVPTKKKYSRKPEATSKPVPRARYKASKLKPNMKPLLNARTKSGKMHSTKLGIMSVNKTSSKYKVVDPDFWDISLEGMRNMKKTDFTTKCLKKQFGCVPVENKGNLTIDNKLIEKAKMLCESDRANFARNLFHSLLSIGETYNKNATGLKGKEKINQVKIQAVRYLTFKYFPVGPNEDEEQAWQVALNRLHMSLWNIRSFLNNWLNLEHVLNKLDQ